MKAGSRKLLKWLIILWPKKSANFYVILVKLNLNRLMFVMVGTFVVVLVFILAPNVEKDIAKNVSQDYVILVENLFVKNVRVNVTPAENYFVRTVWELRRLMEKKFVLVVQPIARNVRLLSKKRVWLEVLVAQWFVEVAQWKKGLVRCIRKLIKP